MLGDVLGGPGGEVGVEEALISAVERTLFGRVRDDGLEQSRRSDEILLVRRSCDNILISHYLQSLSRI